MSALRNGRAEIPRLRMRERHRAVLGKQEMRHRLADDLERPTTTAFSPVSFGRTLLISLRQPSGVQGTKAGLPMKRRPAFTT